MADNRTILLDTRDSQDGIAAALRRAFEAQLRPVRDEEFADLLARIH